MTDLRTLAQAVVDAGPTECIWPVNAPTSALLKALMPEVGDKASPLYDTARTILAALDAADAQGYARAMGEVVEWCKTEARDEWRTWPRGPEYKSAIADVARWAASAAQQPPQPLDRVQEPASRADGQQGRDEGEGV